MVPTHVAELADTGSWSIGVFQILLAGNTGQVPMVDCAPTVRKVKAKKHTRRGAENFDLNMDVVPHAAIRLPIPIAS
jgi:hypothetical protein